MTSFYKSILKDLGLPLSVFVASTSLSLFFMTVSNYISMPMGFDIFWKVCSFFPFVSFIAGIVLSWYFSNTGLLLTSFALSLMYLSALTYGAPIYGKPSLDPAITKIILYVFPLNMIAFSMMIKRRIFTTLGSLYLFIFLLQVFIILVVFYPKGNTFQVVSSAFSAYSSGLQSFLIQTSESLTRFVNKASSLSCVLTFLWTLVFLFIRYIYKRDVRLAGFTLIFVSGIAGILSTRTPSSSFVFFLCSGILVVLASLEGSFVLTDHDHLTGLRGRKALSTFINTLKNHYTVAFVDIDRFEEFNERYGADVGDEVLKVVGDKLEDISKNVQVFRYGSDEFLAVFQECDDQDVISFLEEFRQKIEAFPFIVKNNDHKNTLLRSSKNQKGLIGNAFISVSIGLSTSDKNHKASEILKMADRALCRAKDTGRNKVVVWRMDLGKT